MNAYEVRQISGDFCEDHLMAGPVRRDFTEQEIKNAMDIILEQIKVAAEIGYNALTLFPSENPFFQVALENELKSRGFVIRQKFPLGVEQMVIYW